MDDNQSLRLADNMQPDFEISRVANPQSFVGSAGANANISVNHLGLPEHRSVATTAIRQPVLTKAINSREDGGRQLPVVEGSDS